MTLETILWLVAWVVISEGIFIVWYFKANNDFIWVGVKIVSFFVGGLFVMIQAVIVFTLPAFLQLPQYINLVYEAIILAVIGGLFLINRLISKKIDKMYKMGKKK